jgi:hypothetical protein
MNRNSKRKANTDPEVATTGGQKSVNSRSKGNIPGWAGSASGFLNREQALLDAR